MTTDDLSRAAAMIRASGLFDEAAYARTDVARAARTDPVIDYLVTGEAQGFSPSSAFDTGYYARRYPKSRARGMGPLLHYITVGRAARLRPLPIAASFDMRPLPEGGRPALLMFLHERLAHAPCLIAFNLARQLSSTYTIVPVALSQGMVTRAFASVFLHTLAAPREFAPDWADPLEMNYVAGRAADLYRPTAAIITSTALFPIAAELCHNFCPAVTLVNELPEDPQGAGALTLLFRHSAALVFPSGGMRAAFEESVPQLASRSVHVRMPGTGLDPRMIDAAPQAQGRAAEPLLILSAGASAPHLGLDRLVEIAAHLRARQGQRFRFIWAITGPAAPPSVTESVLGRIAELGIDLRLVQPAGTAEWSKLYREAALFLAPLLQETALPLPAMMAMEHGVPVVCRGGGSALAECLAADDSLSSLVAASPEAADVAAVIATATGDPERLARFRSAVSDFAARSFDGARYAEEVGGAIRRAAARSARIRSAFDVLRSDRQAWPLMEQRWGGPEAAERAMIHVLSTAGFDTGNAPPFSMPRLFTRPHQLRALPPQMRKLLQGVLPGMDEEFAPETFCCLATPALAGKGGRRSRLRVALHAHLFYPELASELLDALAANASSCDLFVTTVDDARAAEIATTLAARGAAADVKVVPNRGRDIGPFLTDICPRLAGQYDVIGHVHSKKSPHLGAEEADRWRAFLFQNLLGPAHPMMDAALVAFEKIDRLGLLFPVNPTYPGWGRNFPIARNLAQRMNIPLGGGSHFDFPAGTMFWCRPAAIDPLLQLGLGWDDYPREPLAVDGTLLHAIERLLPWVARAAGYSIGHSGETGYDSWLTPEQGEEPAWQRRKSSSNLVHMSTSLAGRT